MNHVFCKCGKELFNLNPTSSACSCGKVYNVYEGVKEYENADGKASRTLDDGENDRR